MPKQNSKAQAYFYNQQSSPYVWIGLVFLLATFFAWWYGTSCLRSTWRAWLGYLGQTNRVQAVADASSANDAGTVALLSSLLDGQLVSSSEARTWPYAVMVENLREVRPQSGLSQAAVVYETLAEGGSTRFMAVFDANQVVKEIMPVRSARPYYLEWVSEYGALYAHAGGSPKALTVIRENIDINNLDALTRDGKYFWRDKSRSAPHNLVTSSEKMNFALRDKGLAGKTADFRSWLFKDETALAERGEDGKKVSFNFSSGKTFQVSYQYDRANNQYLRFNADEPHLDKNMGQQLAVKNVIVQLVEEPTLAGEKGRLDIYVGGTGRAWIFLDGQAIAGTWQKDSRTVRTLFFDANGKEVSLNRGNTWVHVVPKDKEVIYQ